MMKAILDARFADVLRLLSEGEAVVELRGFTDLSRALS